MQAQRTDRRGGSPQWVKAIVVALCCLVAAACSREAMLERVTTPQDRELGSKLIESLRSGDNAYVAAHLRPDLRPAAPDTLPKMRQALPSGPDAKIKLMTGSSNAVAVVGGETTKHAYLAYAVDEGNRHALVEVEITRRGEQTTVDQFHVTPLTRAAGEAEPFQLLGKTPMQYLFLVLAVASALTCLTALMVLFLAKNVKWRWLWVIGSLFGIGSFGVNWTTGLVSLSPLYIQLLGASATSTGAGWTVSFGVPVIAILFLVLGRQRIPQPPAEAG